jgi:hypothetical protein
MHGKCEDSPMHPSLFLERGAWVKKSLTLVKMIKKYSAGTGNKIKS